MEDENAYRVEYIPPTEDVLRDFALKVCYKLIDADQTTRIQTCNEFLQFMRATTNILAKHLSSDY